MQAAHAQWTADWLAWERTHDAEYKLKAVRGSSTNWRRGGSPVARAQAGRHRAGEARSVSAAIPDYVQVAKALQSLS